MAQYIDKAALVTEIEKIYAEEKAIFDEQCRGGKGEITMKKIILITVFCMILSSCDFMKAHMDGWANPVYSTDKKIDVTLYEYDGHTYLIFGHTSFANGVVHDPNCDCSKKECYERTR